MCIVCNIQYYMRRILSVSSDVRDLNGFHSDGLLYRSSVCVVGYKQVSRHSESTTRSYHEPTRYVYFEMLTKWKFYIGLDHTQNLINLSLSLLLICFQGLSFSCIISMWLKEWDISARSSAYSKSSKPFPEIHSTDIQLITRRNVIDDELHVLRSVSDE